MAQFFSAAQVSAHLNNRK